MIDCYLRIPQALHRKRSPQGIPLYSPALGFWCKGCKVCLMHLLKSEEDGEGVLTKLEVIKEVIIEKTF